MGECEAVAPSSAVSWADACVGLAADMDLVVDRNEGGVGFAADEGPVVKRDEAAKGLVVKRDEADPRIEISLTEKRFLSPEIWRGKAVRVLFVLARAV